MKYKYFLGLGSNIEPRLKNLDFAIDELQKVGQVLNKSSLYETEPWGNSQQGMYYNAVVLFESELHPQLLIKYIKDTELKSGRRPAEVKWGPRTLDIDILFIENVEINTDDLKVPHPYLSKRKFVLEPLREISDKRMTYFINNLYLNCTDNTQVYKIQKKW